MIEKIELEATYPHPPEAVWKAVTDPRALARWFMPTDMRPMEGLRFRFKKPDGEIVWAKVTEVDEGRMLSFTFRDEENGGESLVVWKIDPVDSGTRFSVRHESLELPPVTCIPIDSYFNWLYALRHSLPGLLALLRAGAGRLPRPPVIYGVEEASPPSRHPSPVTRHEGEAFTRAHP